MSKPDDYREYLKSISEIIGASNVEFIRFRISDPVLGESVKISLPAYENGVFVFDISPPIWGRDPFGPPESPDPPRLPSAPEPANPSSEGTIPVHSEVEKMAAAYGIVAGATFLGSSWPTARENIKLGWQVFCRDDSIAWESAKPQVKHAWNTVGSVFGEYRKAKL